LDGLINRWSDFHK